MPIRDLVTICEAIGDGARTTKEPLFLVEAVRHALARPLSSRYRGSDGAIHAVAVSPVLDSRLGASVQIQPGYVGFDLSGSDSRATIEAIERAVGQLTAAGHPPVLLCSTRIRLSLRHLIERQLPTLAVLSYEEILPSVAVSVHAQVEV